VIFEFSSFENTDQLHLERPVLIEVVEVNEFLFRIPDLGSNGRFKHVQWLYPVFNIVIFFQADFPSPLPAFIAPEKGCLVNAVEFVSRQNHLVQFKKRLVVLDDDVTINGIVFFKVDTKFKNGHDAI